MVDARMFTRSDLGDVLRLVGTCAVGRWPGPVYLMPGDIAWRLPGAAPKQNIRLWFAEGELVGYCWFSPPDGIELDVHPSFPLRDLLPDMLAWAGQRRAGFEPSYPFYLELDSMAAWADALRNPRGHPLAGNRYLFASAFDGDAARRRVLEQHGFEPTGHFELHLSRRLQDAGAPEAPRGMRLRHVEPDDFERRVAVHVAAWAPGSSFDIERYLAVRGVREAFDPELDLVAEAPDGTFASCTIGWLDPVSGVGMFEPMGTRPEFRGSGVGKALILEGLRRMAAKGMHSARIYTAGFNHPAAALYRSCGFRDVDVNRTFSKPC